MSQHLGLGSCRGTAIDLSWSHEVEKYAPACQNLPAAGCRQRRREDLAAAVETMMLIAEGHMLPVEKVIFLRKYSLCSRANCSTNVTFLLFASMPPSTMIDGAGAAGGGKKVSGDIAI